MYELDKKTKAPKVGKAKTSHTLNPVPMIIYDNFTADKYEVVKDGQYGLSNVAATTVNMLGYEAPEMWDKSVIDVK
jgi:2,3-bisphosphoglycerate-independent phosphoglycerate mutase